ncbi:MAG TPA: hypothetical protein DCQ26_12110 [Marinilabiliales bacterium]|jgi:hypothetical protein|nr:MAG: hypothetical protein A2W95_04595 [Bacteroidetes bacterium GWA2_40_14]OFX60152.1 MAG: hypothetical protein A2W84_17905 [Bacteroidetes bacterium GWC2_40_13]OFX76101.1 MAG: hypothetical protein A2W96_01480 [Bacteroidetes bacterium GWD2_40_43]OFX94285.1 MAG: hypothetical protein A2W97_19140 [Bacteroidetes bacterium GWE2_40_63]OFY18764.1 MAG: hypothetical protein A2W88_05905 [Bacteroidetes bacterium GWF2_40_13]OFZ23529.1 MAG: hypothetical protein A2437_17870 [Bacteroidetes bacterium RIFOXYC
MKTLVTLVAILGLGFATALNAKKLPSVAAKLPVSLKETIAENLDYPSKAEMNMIEGDVWLKICVNEESLLKIVEISATDPLLGEFVKKELSSLYVENPGCKAGQIYYLKIKFDITSNNR